MSQVASYAALFFAGAFLMNVVPHLVAGVMGQRFQSPFSRPPGKGLSSPAANVVWAFINLAVAYGLVRLAGGVDWSNLAETAAFGAGLFLMGLALARHFGRQSSGE